MIVAMNERQRWGDLVKAAMEAQGMQGKDLARATGWSTSVVSELLSGSRKTIPPDVVRAIWRVLGLSMRTQVETLGYLDPEEVEPGIAYAIPERTTRADLLHLLDGASDKDVRTVMGLAKVIMQGYSQRNGDAVGFDDEASPNDRSA